MHNICTKAHNGPMTLHSSMSCQLRALPHERRAYSWCRLANDLGPCGHFTPTIVEPPHERREVSHHWRRLGTKIRRKRAGESGRGRSWLIKGWPPLDFMGFQWEFLGISDCLNSWTRYHTSPQIAVCVVSDKVVQPIKATGSWKLPVVWQGPKLESGTRHNMYDFC